MNRHPNTRGLRPPWQKGQPSPNPSGRPKRLPISDVYAKLAAEPVPRSMRKILKRAGVVLPANATFAEALALRVFSRAISGDCGAAREIRESIEGKAGQRIEPVDTPEPTGIVIRFVGTDGKQERLASGAGTETELMDSEVPGGAARIPVSGSHRVSGNGTRSA